MSKTSMEIHDSDMSDEMQREALQVGLLAVNMYSQGIDIATYMVKEFERKHGLTWHCFIGSSGSHVRPNQNGYICFSVGGKRIVLFRTD
ncbi:dynein 8 kDa light chain, flagellar outer arm-like [Megalobrama amblycephala]|uniref:dynein 8 kDa light chain, flagellar outer arm-like n=1 Tax=Megalobrama amblycephala TaxID=75352 RepID=UPI002013FBAC|nr:dynein 8 kDa light chain, flagellar outer arm-like [Megalobrama amblycephala]